RVYFSFHIIKALIIPVSYDSLTLSLELIQIIYNLTSEEGIPIFQSRFVNDYRSSLGLDPLHNALDAALTEVITVALHRQPVHTNNNFFLTALIPGIICSISSSNLQNTVCYEIFPRPVAL